MKILFIYKYNGFLKFKKWVVLINESVEFKKWAILVNKLVGFLNIKNEQFKLTNWKVFI